MRILIALVMASGLFAQPPRFMRPIDGYLELSREQTERVNQNISDYANMDRTASIRQAVLYGEILRETNAEPLNPTALDVRYAEQEMLRRQSEARRKQLIAANVAILTAAQRQKLAQLQDSQRLASLAADARDSGLIDPECVGLVAFFGPPAPSAELSQYLRLTPEQTRAMLDRQQRASRELFSMQMQLSQANFEFSRVNAAEPLDPQMLGDLAVRRETLERDLKARLKSLYADNRAALTAEQRRSIEALIEAEKQSPFLNGAQGIFVEQTSQSLRPSLGITPCVPQSFSFLP